MGFETITRRNVLQGFGGLGCSAAAYPLLTQVSLASAPWEPRLVVIVLRGAMDGLDVVRPVGDPNFAGLRTDLGTDTEDLDGFFHLHAGLSDLMPLWQQGELAFAHAVSTPYRDQRSHFDGQDMLEAGTARLARDGARTDGWLNRLLQVTPGVQAETAYAVGRDNLRILSGQAEVANWAPDARFNLGQSAQDLLRHIYQNDALFLDAAEEAIALSSELEEGGRQARIRGLPERPIAEFVASRLVDDTRIASFSISGWDTHGRQQQRMPGLLARLSDTILTLRAGLGPVWSQTTVLAITEFGRTARQNGSGGTDHGTAGAMVMAGGAVRGGQVYGSWPGLAEVDLYDRRDLMPTADVRRYAAWAMRTQYGLERSVLERSIFPGLDLDADPGAFL